MTRRIPSTMATQHPDNAGPAFWQESGDPFIGTDKEVKDLLVCFQDLGVDEYMWDWEGKYADSSVIDKLYGLDLDYFRDTQLGVDKFITFRVPNVWQEKGYSLMQALSVYLSAEDLARDVGIKNRPLFEVILPMTESSDQLMHLHNLFHKLAVFKNEVFTVDGPDNTDGVEVIPLVESVASQQGVGLLLEEYANAYEKLYKKQLTAIRPFLACSDPALVSGWLATILANKNALSQVHSFGLDRGIQVSPIAGAGSLPFRGGLSPESVDTFVSVYGGLRTVSIQSSFRYDHPLDDVKDAINTLHEKLPSSQPMILTNKQTTVLKDIVLRAEECYQKTLQVILPDMQPFFKAVPPRRERRLHIGLLAYDRNMKGNRLPRAITFTSAFYSLGVPPEFIGLGRTLAQLTDDEKRVLTDVLPELSLLVERAGQYINRSTLSELAQNNSAWADIQSDIKLCERFFDTHYAPETIDQKSHQFATANVLLMKDDPKLLTRHIHESALLRRSLG